MKPSNPHRRLSGIDAAFLYLERRELPLHIAGVCLFDGPIPFKEFVAALDSKLHLIPRYRQIVADPPFHMGSPTWEDDVKFDIRHHAFAVHVDPPGGQAEMEALAGRILTGVMDRRRPLWDIHVIDGLAGGRGAVIARIHHALADGIAGAQLIKIMFDPTPEGSQAIKKPRYRPKPASGQSPSMAEVLSGMVRSSLESMMTSEAILLDFAKSLFDERTQTAIQKFLQILPEFAASSEKFPFNKPCTGDRLFCWTDLAFADAQAIRASCGGTLNDVVLTVVTRAIARYIKLHKEPVAGRFLRIVCPVSVRHDDHGESLGNQISFIPVALPLDLADPVEMLKAVTARTEIMKSAHASHLIALLGSWIGSAPPPVQALFWNAVPQFQLPLSLFNMICTNVPGSPTPLYAAGRKMIASYPHVPTGYELGVNCAVQSYDGKLFCGLTADSDVVPDVNKLRDFIHDAFNELRKAAGVRVRKPRTRKPKAAPPLAVPVPAPPEFVPIPLDVH